MAITFVDKAYFQKKKKKKRHEYYLKWGIY